MHSAPQYLKIQSLFQRDPETKYKTLLEGIYSTPEFESLAQTPIWRFEEKVDGTNLRVQITPTKLWFHGRTDKAQIPPHLQERLSDLFSGERLAGLREAFPRGVVLYGEGYGNKVQKVGHRYRPDQGFLMFDAVTLDQGTGELNWLQREALESVAEAHDLEIAPVVGRGTLLEAVELIREEGLYSRVAQESMLAEGVVIKTDPLLRDKRGVPVITKLKHADFRLPQPESKAKTATTEA